ncbi:hypothetical protein DERF_012906 [Dermatophagoides farinae]|uniref:Uncharacterized protein n=1 Tax=Dermatophagoides farinae TaxID=6954 RepID=A0A922L276_DERFA|nr:hypothetical protein DERF_012906 [Dermatophagoides farinae]
MWVGIFSITKSIVNEISNFAFVSATKKYNIHTVIYTLGFQFLTLPLLKIYSHILSSLQKTFVNFSSTNTMIIFDIVAFSLTNSIHTFYPESRASNQSSNETKNDSHRSILLG